MTSVPVLDGITARDAGTVLAAVLAASRRPATAILEHLGATTLTLKVLATAERPLTDVERHRLQSRGVLPCRHRHGLLITAEGVTAASVSLTWLPGRLPPETRQELDAGSEPAGTILGRLGMTRQDRRAMPTGRADEITGEPLAAVASAVLVVGDWPVGIAEEYVTLAFAETLT